MRILITNDDGIGSPVLPLLAKWASKLGEVTVAAPKVEQSGKSQAIDFTHPIAITKGEILPGITSYTVDSTPADCVRFAIRGLGINYDLILSGINRGYNLGDDIVYSGTCGAIFEGARLGVRGLAISTDPEHLMDAPKALDTLWEYIQANDLYSHNPLYNANIPPEPKGLRITKQGGPFFTDTFIHDEGHLYVQSGQISPDSGSDPTTDINSVRAGLISVTPLAASRTEMSVFERLNKI